jgi:AcrR family transcriptional regulator
MSPELTAKGLATKSRIIEHATAIVCERGVANTSLETIRDAAGVSSSQLFHYFPEGRSALMHAVAMTAADAVIAHQEPLLSHLTTWRAWNEWADALLKHFAEQGRANDLKALLGMMDQDTPEVRAIMTTVYDRWEERLADGIRSMQAAGKVRQDLDPVPTATVMLAGIHGGMLMSMATGRQDRLRTTLRAALESLRR